VPLEADIDVRRVRLREVPRLAWVAGRTMEAEARGVLRPDGTRRRRLHRTWAVCPPRPLRFYVVLVQCFVTLAVAPSWVGRTASDVAVVSTWPVTGAGRYAWRLRAACAVLAGFVAWCVGLVVVVTRWPGTGVMVASGLAAVIVVGAIPVAWPAPAGLRDHRATKSLREAQRKVVDEATGPVHWAAGLASGNHGAGLALTRAVVARLDASDITIVARTEQGPLVRLYRWAGFTVAAEAPTTWGTAVLVVRRPTTGWSASEGRSASFGGR